VEEKVVLGLLFWVRKRVFVSDFRIKRIKKVLIINGIALGRGKAYRRFDFECRCGYEKPWYSR
jgi:hypothetical protein